MRSSTKKFWQEKPISTLPAGAMSLTKQITGTGGTLCAHRTAAPISDPQIDRFRGLLTYHSVKHATKRVATAIAMGIT